MNKMSLLLVVLSVCALHAADEKELPMKQINDGRHLYAYKDEVIAYTGASFDAHKYGNVFTFEPDKKKEMAIRFGLVYCRSYRNDLGKIEEIIIRRFLKKDACPSNFTAGQIVRTKEKKGNDSKMELDAEVQEDLERANLKVRLATEEEKEKLKKALLDDDICLEYYNKEKALDFF